MQHRMSPFYLATLSFLGFSRDEQRHMEEITCQNGEYASNYWDVQMFEKYGTF